MRLLQLFLLLVCALGGSAQAMEPFPGAVNYENKQESVSRYRLILSEIEKSKGKVIAEQEKRIQGALERSIWELPSDLTLEDVFDHYFNQAANKQVLFQCQGIYCGVSHLWANDIFNHARLVSRQKDQAYFAAVSPTQDQQYRLEVVYISMRGGRQPRVLVDTLITSESLIDETRIEEAIKQSLANSSGWLPGFVTQNSKQKGAQFDVQASQALITEINSMATSVKQRLHLVVQCYEGRHFEETLACSEQLADALKAELDASIHVQGQGALTPSPTTTNEPALRFVFWPGR